MTSVAPNNSGQFKDSSMNDKSDDGDETVSAVGMDIEQTLHDKVNKWRGKLLDIGNRNPLVNCSFNPSRGVIEIVTPDCETVWRTLAADSEAGADPMRFPWRRELVPAPAEELARTALKIRSARKGHFAGGHQNYGFRSPCL